MGDTHTYSPSPPPPHPPPCCLSPGQGQVPLPAVGTPPERAGGHDPAWGWYAGVSPTADGDTVCSRGGVMALTPPVSLPSRHPGAPQLGHLPLGELPPDAAGAPPRPPLPVPLQERLHHQHLRVSWGQGGRNRGHWRSGGVPAVSPSRAVCVCVSPPRTFNDESPLGLRRILSQSTDSLNMRNRTLSVESLIDEGGDSPAWGWGTRAGDTGRRVTPPATLPRRPRRHPQPADERLRDGREGLRGGFVELGRGQQLPAAAQDGRHEAPGRHLRWGQPGLGGTRGQPGMEGQGRRCRDGSELRRWG